MKVLLFSTQWPEYMISLANSMAKHANTTLMLPSNHRFTEEHKTLISKEVKFVPYHVVFHKSIRDNFFLLKNILRTIWEIKPHILHIQANGHRLFYWIALFKPWNTKIINTIHDPEKHLGDRVSRQIKDNTVKFLSPLFTKKYIVHGIALKDELAKSYKVGNKKIVSIPHGHFEIYKSFTDTTFKVNHKDYILFFGRIWKYKGLQYFIDAANIVLLKYPNTIFYIVGQGEDLNNYKFDLANKNNFTIINRRVSLAEANIIYQNALITVLPYVEATQSGVIPVSYAFAKPVIATNVGSIGEMVIDGKTGFLIEKRNSAQIAEKLIEVLENDELITKMGKEAYKFAKENLSWDLIAQSTYDVYCEQ
ncbi:MAG: starch synthase [Psychroserpens sp.]|jgi:starch synthase